MLTIGVLISFVIVLVGIGIAYVLERGAKALLNLVNKVSETSEVYANTEYYTHMALEEITKQLEVLNKPERKVNVILPEVDTKGDYFTDLKVDNACAELFLHLLMNHPLEPEVAFLGVHDSLRNVNGNKYQEYNTFIVEVSVNGESIYMYLNTEISYLMNDENCKAKNPLIKDEFDALISAQKYIHVLSGLRIYYPDNLSKYELKVDMIYNLLEASKVEWVSEKKVFKVPGSIRIFEVAKSRLGTLILNKLDSKVKGFIEVQEIDKYYPINRISYKRENVNIDSSNRDKGIKFLKEVLQSESTSNMILLGEPGAGKSALLRRIFTEKFDTNLFIVVVDKQEVSTLLGIEGKELLREMMSTAEETNSKLILVIDNANQLITNSEEADKLATLTDGLNSSDFQLILVFNGDPKQIRKDFTNRSGRLPIEIEFSEFTPEEFVEAAKSLNKELTDGRRVDFDRVEEVIRNGEKLNTDLLFSCIILPTKEDPAQILFLELAGKHKQAEELRKIDEELVESDDEEEDIEVEEDDKDGEGKERVAVKPPFTLKGMIKQALENADKMNEFI